MRVIFVEPAREEFLEAVEFYEEQISGLGADLLAEVEERIETLKAAPDLGAPYVEETRRTLLHRFPYSIIYLVDTDGLVILALAHQRRKPDYWKSRL